MNPTNFEAYFLGPKGENFEFYQRLLFDLLKDHIEWRQAFHSPDSLDFITREDKQRGDFKEAQSLIEENLLRLRELLKKNQPFFSPRYIGHMNWEVMAAPILAFFAAALYNPNNVAKAGSTGTSQLELEVGKELVRLFGIDTEKGWGHICAGGTIANIEALWIARNMKFIPLALKKLLEQLNLLDMSVKIQGQTIHIGEYRDIELLKNFSPEEILDLKEVVLSTVKKELQNDQRVDDLFEEYSFQGCGFSSADSDIEPGIVFLPQTKHYSFKKAMDLLGLGWNRIRYVPVNEKFRMDMDALEEMVFEESEKYPILAVVGVLGSTEESSIDEIFRIVEIRKKIKKEKGIGFHIHVDAAYGGYVKSLLLDENNEFMTKQQLDERLRNFGIIGDKPERKYASWPSDEVFQSYQALAEVDTITIDPHKLGYVLYPAGAIVMKDRRMREAIQTFAPYVFSRPDPDEPDDLIGAYILEGSKPGASAAAVWLAHRIMPLNINGYGKLIGETIDGAQALWYALNHAQPFEIDEEIKIKPHPLIKPDLNIVNYTFNFVGNASLEKMNRLTSWIFEELLGPLPEEGDTILEKTYIVSMTSFTIEEYKDSPLPFLRGIGIPDSDWKKIGKLDILRSVVMSPYLTPDYVDENYVEKFIDFLEQQLVMRKEAIMKLWKS